jgi:hypothetical protein
LHNSNSKPLCYIAGPYTVPDPVENTHHACKVGTRLIEDGIVIPFIPHSALIWHLVTPRPPDFWYNYELLILLHCDVLLRIPGDSLGADIDVDTAIVNLIPVFTDIEQMYASVQSRPSTRAILPSVR